MARDLEGILVVGLEQAVAAPLASRLLADAGARVIKVERHEGDFARDYDKLVQGESAHFVWLNRGKESLRLDLKAQDDFRLLERMLASADVLIQNLAPGAIDRLRLGIDVLAERYPRLVVCSISGYGETGPYRDMKAYDLLVQAESGLASVNGIGEVSTRVGVSVCDIAAGMTAYQGILQALFARERTGRGRHVPVSLFGAIGEWMNVPFLQFVHGGQVPPRLGLYHPSIAPYGVYDCRDGALLIAIQNEREWVRLCAEVLQRPDFATDARFVSNPDRVAHRAALDVEIERVFGELGREALVERLEKAKIAYGRLSTLADLAHHPQNTFVRTRLESGAEIDVLASAPGVVTGVPSVPKLGEHDDSLRREFGS